MKSFSLDEIVQRPLAHLRLLRKVFPEALHLVDQARCHCDWPPWCFVPTYKLFDTIPFSKVREIKERGFDINPGDVAAIGGWRSTQGIYLFDLETLESLWTTSIKGDIPAKLLQHLPEWCPYLAFPQPRIVSNKTAYGFFVYLDYAYVGDDKRGPALIIVIDCGITQSRLIFPLPLIGSLEESMSILRRQDKEIEQETDIDFKLMYQRGNKKHDMELLWSNPLTLAPLVSLVLYLCSAEPDIHGNTNRTFQPPYRPHATRTRHGPKTFPPSAPMVWEVGYRIGTILRHTKEQKKPSGAPEGTHSAAPEGTHASPRAHMRQAHWHIYWTGPKKAPQAPKARWLHPILINGNDEDLIPTVHRVM